MALPEAKTDSKTEGQLRLIKKYPNRRLYDTKTSSYITLADVKQMVLKQEEFQVVDAKSGEELTRQILLQIILEEEQGGLPMFSSDLLSQLIRFYGNAMQGLMGTYLEKNIRAFHDMQKTLQEQSARLYGGDSTRGTQDLWAQFMNLQGPAMQSLMQAYVEQSQKMFAQFQEQMQNQARNMFTGLSFPGFPRRPRTTLKKSSNSHRAEVGFVSLGCPKALVDSERILTQLRAEGYQTAPDYAGADLVIVNTCGFIDAAVEESLDAIGEALAENGRVIVTGCLGSKKELINSAHPAVLAVTGPHDTPAVMKAVHAHLPKPHDPYVDLVPPQGIKLTPQHYAYLKISEGCNHRCTFCIIPSMRGDLVSPPDRRGDAGGGEPGEGRA